MLGDTKQRPSVILKYLLAKLTFHFFFSFRLWRALVNSKDCTERTQGKYTRRETVAQCARGVGEENVLL